MYSQQWSPAPSMTASAPELRTAKAVIAPAARDLRRGARADGAVEVAELIVPFAPALVLDGVQHVAHHALGELALIDRRIRGRDGVLRRIGGEPAVGQDGREV